MISADLTQPVDVYYDWIDACDSVATEGGDATSSQPTQSRSVPQPRSRAGLAPGEKITADDTGFIDDDGVEADDYGDED
jgi:transcription elongation factor Elf1